jgi:CheY-like chemotaxis protein
LLRSAGYDIISAVTGNEALEVFVMADPPVQLVLLDVTLPDMSGHEVQDLNT